MLLQRDRCLNFRWPLRRNKRASTGPLSARRAVRERGSWERRTAVVEVDVELLATTPDERSRNARPLWPAGRRVWVFDGVVWGGEYANAATIRAAPKRLEAAVMCGRSAGGGGGGSGGGVGRVEGSVLSGGAYVGDRGDSRQGGGRRQRGCWGALAPNHLSSRRRRRFQGSRPCC